MTASVAPLTASRLRPVDVVGVGMVGIRQRRLRTVLTAVGIAVGIAAMVAVVGISSSSRAHLLATLDALGTDYLRVGAGDTFLGDSTELPDAAAAMVRRVDGVEAAAQTAPVRATVRRTDHIPSGETGSIAVMAAESELIETLNGSLADGRFLDAAAADLPVVVLGSVTAERLGIRDLDGAPLVWLGDRWYAVIGILDTLPLAPELDTAALIGWVAAGQLAGETLAPSTVYVRTVEGGVDAVRPLLARTLRPDGPEQIQVSRPSDAIQARAAADAALTALLLGLGGVALLVGGIGIANVMVVAVLERRSEVGIRRALGATRRHIRLQFVLEAVLLAGLGGVGGIIIGGMATWGYATDRDWPVALPLSTLGGGVAVALLVGAVAGLYPAARAARLAPADAVRPV